tara:strand:- start:3664 stop:5400 length:1737 start_codon:yes stop_codon:yes gene_type:complete
MALEQLKSLFQPTDVGSSDSKLNSIEPNKEVSEQEKNFKSNNVTNVNDTNFFNKPPRPTINIATNPTDFSTAVDNNKLSYTPKSIPFKSNDTGGGISFMDDLSWESLYNSNHSPIDNPSHKGLVPISYPNVNRDNLNIRNQQDGRFGIATIRSSVIGKIGKLLGSVGTGDVQQFLQDTGKEPYIVSKIPTGRDNGFNGRLINFGGRDLPIARSLTDAVRLAKFMTSPAGLIFIAKQNFLGRNSMVQYLDTGGELRQSRQRFKESYNPLSTIIQSGFRAGGVPVSLFDKTEPGLSTLFGGDQYGNTNLIGGNVPYNINKSFTDGFDNLSTSGLGGVASGFGDKLKEFGNKLKSNLTGTSETIKSVSEGGDLFTNITFRDNLPENPMAQQTIEDAYGKFGRDILEDKKQGMPFYFKDMRTNAYIFFRAYIEGLTENISPSYAPTNYIGRSEPVYTYERAEREISMTLKLVAQTREELTSIYTKMDRLTSMCYPEYVDDDYGSRMKPPLAKLRYGELFGKENKELMGYIKSISYSVDQSSTYETDVGYRVPRHVLATIGYQVIHDRAPRLGTTFYGINQNG